MDTNKYANVPIYNSQLRINAQRHPFGRMHNSRTGDILIIKNGCVYYMF
jgi:hypothetical protein